MNELDQPRSQAHDISWPMLLTIAAVIIGSLALLQYNVLYTEGEVTQGLFTLLIFLTLGLVAIGFYRRTVAAWSVVLLGGSLLLWQAYQTRKWAVIHEEIIRIVRFAEETKAGRGNYPTNLKDYTFKTQWVKNHIHRFGLNEANGFGVTYFMNDPGITYWYSSKTGFGYYPD